MPHPRLLSETERQKAAAAKAASVEPVKPRRAAPTVSLVHKPATAEEAAAKKKAFQEKKRERAAKQAMHSAAEVAAAHHKEAERLQAEAGMLLSRGRVAEGQAAQEAAQQLVDQAVEVIAAAKEASLPPPAAEVDSTSTVEAGDLVIGDPPVTSFHDLVESGGLEGAEIFFETANADAFCYRCSSGKQLSITQDVEWIATAEWCGRLRSCSPTS